MFLRRVVVVFADLFFIYFFLPLCLIFYFITKKTGIRNCVLIVFSLVFYAWGEKAREKMSECEDGKLSLEEFSDWLKQS